MIELLRKELHKFKKLLKKSVRWEKTQKEKIFWIETTSMSSIEEISN